jgi:hypothetical protein
MPEQLSLEQLQKLAAETILSASSLTDELTDEEARPLIAWGMAQAKAAARQVASQAFTTALPAQDIREIVANRLTPVRRTLKLINNLVAERHDLSVETMTEELQYLHELAGRLPEPPLAAAGEALSELAAQQTDMDNATFVSAVLSSLAKKSPTEQKPPEEMLEPGGNLGKEKENTGISQSSSITTCGDSDRPAPYWPLPPTNHWHFGPGPI